MKKFTVVVLASAILVACHGKKPSATPSGNDKAPLEHKDDATGGRTYGGQKSDGGTGKATPDPSAAH